MIRVIDDEDVAERIHIWIRKQNFNTTPTTFKKFVENELFPAIRIAREKSITIMTATRCEFMDQIYLNLPEGEKERVLVTKNGEMPLQKKGNRRSIMVSEFLTEINGRLHLKQADIEKHPYIPEKARYFLKPGINQEGYWTAEHLLEQIECKAISIFEALYPDCIAVFAFDNSSNHAAFSKDALVAS
uniref:Uncharacterized protein n=2 Tax=Rhizophagus irregularis TaxID=588596 RepID=U9SS71_RHIID